MATSIADRWRSPACRAAASRTVDTQFEAKAGEGVVQRGPGEFHVTASGGSILMIMPPERGHVVAHVRLHRTPQLAHRSYRIAINQIEMPDGAKTPRRVGGVAYDLQP